MSDNAGHYVLNGRCPECGGFRLQLLGFAFTLKLEADGSVTLIPQDHLARVSCRGCNWCSEKGAHRVKRPEQPRTGW